MSGHLDLSRGGSDSGHGSGGGRPDHGGGKDEAHIIFGRTPVTVRSGDWVVSELKQELGVDAAKVLAEITPSGLKDLDDSAHIEVRDGMRFMSHVRKGGAS